MFTSRSQSIEKTNGVPATLRPVVAREIRELEQRMEDASRWIAPAPPGNRKGHRRPARRSSIASSSACSRTGTSFSKACPGSPRRSRSRRSRGASTERASGAFSSPPTCSRRTSPGRPSTTARPATFQVKHGPVFANLVLADEINRAPAKVQSALLEAMQERQVTLGDETFALPDPFLVLATQNPLEQEGTYPLPEAQIDRFMMKVLVRYPSVAEERAILDAMAVSKPQLDRLPRRHAGRDRGLAARRRRGVRRRRDPRLHRAHRLRHAGAGARTTSRSRASCAPAPRRAERSRSRSPRAPGRSCKVAATSSRRTSRRSRPTCSAIA